MRNLIALCLVVVLVVLCSSAQAQCVTGACPNPGMQVKSPGVAHVAAASEPMGGIRPTFQCPGRFCQYPAVQVYVPGVVYVDVPPVVSAPVVMVEPAIPVTPYVVRRHYWTPVRDFFWGRWRLRYVPTVPAVPVSPPARALQ